MGEPLADWLPWHVLGELLNKDCSCLLRGGELDNPMPNPFLGVRIPPDIHEAILARMQETGESKSDIVIQSLRAYLGLPSSHDRLTQVEERLAILEQKFLEGESVEER